MPSMEFKNNTRSTVADNPLTSGATTLNVASGGGANFPASFPFKLTLWDAAIYPNPGDDPGMEIVECTGRTTDALTIVRGEEDTADVDHAFGERVAMLWTAGHFNDATTGIVTRLDTIEPFIDQSVISGASPTFDGANITNVDADTLIVDVKEAGVSAVTKGQMCAIVGSSGAKFEVQLCDCDDAALIRVLGLVVSNTAQNEIGQVIYKGLLTNVNSQIGNTDVNPNGETWLAGDLLFVSTTPGGLTNVRPSSGRCIKAGRTLKGNSASDTFLAIVNTNSICACAASGEDVCSRMGDNDGVNKHSFKDYANNEVAAFDSNGNLTLIGNVDGRDVSVDGTKLDTVEENAKDDQIASEVPNTPAGNIAATDVQAAINELDTEKLAKSGDTDLAVADGGTGASNASTARTNLGVAIGTDVPAESDMTAVENRATAIENDIDYPTAVKQKVITDTGEDGGVEGGVFNGDFEYGSGSQSVDGFIGDKKHGWWADVTGNAIASFDDSVSYNGNQSLKLDLTDASATCNVKRNSAESLLFPVKPSQKYRVSCRIKTLNAAADSAFFTTGQYDSDGNSIAGTWTNGTSAKLSGDNDWTYIEKIITTHADAVTIDSYIYHNVAGNIATAWFDDFKIEQIDTQAVNTQVNEIVSVSVEGVTTTDNIDQYLETSGNTYTLTTGIDEGATHRQTFTPTADRGDGKHILTKIQALVAAVGTGDWTLVVHDAANNLLASTTIVVGSMSTGDINFDVPAILDVGTAYHFHIYSTVADGTVTTTDNADLETVDFHAQFAKHTESPVISANGGSFDMTGVKLLTGATITVNANGSGRYIYDNQITDAGLSAIHDLDSTTVNNFDILTAGVLAGNADNVIVFKFDTGYPITSARLLTQIREGTTRSGNIYSSKDGVTYDLIHTGDTAAGDGDGSALDIVLDVVGSDVIYIKFDMNYISADWLINYITIGADLNCQAALPIFVPSTEVTTETSDLTLNPIDISKDGYLQLNTDLTGWGSRTFTMLASEAAFESQAVSANYIYMYDSNGTTPWTWDERNGLVPPADRTSGTVVAKFLVGDNQIKSSVNDGSMKANVNLSWNEESLRAAINRLTALANLQYPIVIEVEDVPAIDIQDQPTGASAETGYTNDVTSLRQTAAATPAIAYTGLLPRENQFSEWLDITVVCSDGDGTLQGKLYTVDGTLIETYADLESNPVLTISNPDYKYSRERLILQISASLETTGTAWSVTDIKWRYQYNG